MAVLGLVRDSAQPSGLKHVEPFGALVLCGLPSNGEGGGGGPVD